MIQFLKDNLDRQLQFLGLVFGFWGLWWFNTLIVNVLNGYVGFVGQMTPINYILVTIFQTWVVIKYIMKK